MARLYKFIGEILKMSGIIRKRPAEGFSRFSSALYTKTMFFRYFSGWGWGVHVIHECSQYTTEYGSYSIFTLHCYFYYLSYSHGKKLLLKAGKGHSVTRTSSQQPHWRWLLEQGDLWFYFSLSLLCDFFIMHTHAQTYIHTHTCTHTHTYFNHCTFCYSTNIYNI